MPERHPSRTRTRRSAASSYGGMQEREIQTRLEIVLDCLSIHKPTVTELARRLTGVSLAEQQRVLGGIEALAALDTGLAETFCNVALDTFAELDDTDWSLWLQDITHAYRNHCASVPEAVFHLPPAPGDTARVDFEDVATPLTYFLTGLLGRRVTLLTYDSPGLKPTDGTQIYLPRFVAEWPIRAQNALLYKTIGVHQWAQIAYGSPTRRDDRLLSSFPDRERIRRIFDTWENYRLDACIARDCPGLGNDLASCRPPPEPLSDVWREAVAQIRDGVMTASDTASWLTRLARASDPPPGAPYQQISLYLQSSAAPIEPVAEVESGASSPTAEHDSEPTPTTRWFGRLITHLGFYNPNPRDGGAQPTAQGAPSGATASTPADTDARVPAAGESVYDEWDHSSQRYRKRWCTVTEKPVQPAPRILTQQALDKHRHLIRRLKRHFEVLRADNLRQKRQWRGETIDIDTLIGSHTDWLTGREYRQDYWIDNRRRERDIATLLLVDMSGSTSGWTINVERESILLLSEVLHTLRDRFAIYGFSGSSRRGCTIYDVKRFDEPYQQVTRGRITGMTPRSGTRMGAAVRHMTEKLRSCDAKSKLLLIVSDGQPEDKDGYRGRYAIEDTRRAIFEARRSAVYALCITVDRSGLDYLPHMFGQHNFAIIQDIHHLPAKLSELYYQITH